MAVSPRTSTDTLPRAAAVMEEDVTAQAERIEPLIPKWAKWFYLLTPPLLALMLHPELFDQGRTFLINTVLATWIHAVAIGASLHLLYARAVPHVLRESHKRPLRLFIHACAILLGVSAGTAISVPVATIACGWGPRRPWWELYTSLTISSVFVLATVSYQRLRKRAREVEKRALQAQQAELRARLSSLTARTNPHFLFNSLNTVAGLIGEDPERAEDAVERLADLFRYTLDASRRARVQLRDEVSATRSYLEMEALRYEERLSYHLEVDDAALSLSVPPLLLQPLVENAIRHGIEGRGKGSIEIQAHCEGDQLFVNVADDGPGPGRSRHVGSQTSLVELRQRLQLLYADDAFVSVSARESGGCEVLLSLPAEHA